MLFLSTPSARRATQKIHRPAREPRISIHALREEGDVPLQGAFAACNISIHALREEGDLPYRCLLTRRPYFYPRPPRGGRPLYLLSYARKMKISIHALREEGDRRLYGKTQAQQNFYPRPPRGGRPPGAYSPGRVTIFLSTPSARRATDSSERRLVLRKISIHALREEGDRLPQEMD